MIKKIDIQKFGVFENYSWDATVGSNEGFRKLNIIYGRNYVGKTTLSRILRCLENKVIHNQYQDGNFNLSFYDGKIITHNNIHQEINQNIRVYNTDFVKENLSWLHNEDGSIMPFTILGSKNVELDKKINEIIEQLGDASVYGLLNQQHKKTVLCKVKKDQYNENVNDLNTKLRNKAVEVKNNASIYDFPTYQINSIKKDIESNPKILNDEKIFDLKKLLKEESKGNLDVLLEAKPNFNKYLLDTQELLEKEITPTKPISDLINNSLLQEWVRQGIDKHKNLRNTCGFCGGQLPDDLWRKLDEHFSQESEELRINIDLQIKKLNTAKAELDTYLNISSDDFYYQFLEEFNILNALWNKLKAEYQNNIDELIKQLEGRNNSIFDKLKINLVKDLSEDILELFKKFNEVITANNLRTSSLSTDQKKAKELLRLSEVARYIKDIDYNVKLEEIELLKEESEAVEREKNDIDAEVTALLEEKRILEAQSKDESKGAELVNHHLTHFFGHQELKLVAEGESPNIKFKIIRNNIKATNLSEGESSLISFCYFIAKLEDELNDDLSDKLIIYIDDPISSLDNNHIFFMFSLIETIIARPKKYSQLFISTHNLDFLKYLRKLTAPNKYKFTSNGKDISGLANFILERKNTTKVQLNISPIYLRKYITEFNYLFEQIYKCSISDVETISHDYQYNFGNNMRKFLEAYLFYKYPSHNLNLDKRLDNFFGTDTISKSLVNRVINEYSHLEDNFERGLEPIDVDAVHLISKSVLERIKQIDLEQYNALIDSITNVSE